MAHLEQQDHRRADVMQHRDGQEPVEPEELVGSELGIEKNQPGQDHHRKHHVHDRPVSESLQDVEIDLGGRRIGLGLALEDAAAVVLHLRQATLDDAGRLRDVLPPVAGNDVANHENHPQPGKDDASHVVDARRQRELHQRKAWVGKVQADAGDRQGDDRQGIAPVPQPDPQVKDVNAISHGFYSGADGS